MCQRHRVNAQVFDGVEEADLQSPTTEVQLGTSAAEEPVARPAGSPPAAQSDPQQVKLPHTCSYSGGTGLGGWVCFLDVPSSSVFRKVTRSRLARWCSAQHAEVMQIRLGSTQSGTHQLGSPQL